jgi:hypothetical protein
MEEEKKEKRQRKKKMMEKRRGKRRWRRRRRQRRRGREDVSCVSASKRTRRECKQKVFRNSCGAQDSDDRNAL